MMDMVANLTMDTWINLLNVKIENKEIISRVSYSTGKGKNKRNITYDKKKEIPVYVAYLSIKCPNISPDIVMRLEVGSSKLLRISERFVKQ